MFCVSPGVDVQKRTEELERERIMVEQVSDKYGGILRIRNSC